MMSFTAAVLAKVTVTTALALCGVRLARRSRAAVRHVVLATAFAVLLVLPIVSTVAPSIRVAVPIAVQDAVSVPVDALIEATAIGGAALPAPAPVNAAPSSSEPPLQALLAAGWILGTAFFLLPVILGLWQVRSLRRSGIPWREGRTVVEALAVEAGIRRRVSVLLHEAVPGPMTCGLLQPDVVLPTDARTWPEEDLRRAIVHELEHVRRADWLSQCLARTLCAVYWFHPLVWIAWRQLSLEAERACDDAVLRKAEAADYADQLVVLARRLAAGPGQAQLAMANRADLATRVVAVLDSHQRRGRAGVRWVSFAIAASALLITAISPLRVVADQTPSGPPAVAQKYDVASIRPCRTEEAPPGPARGGAGGTNATFSPGRFNVPCVTVEQLIYLAYAGTGATKTEWLANDELGTASDSTKVRGGPAWVHSQKDKYAIEATAPGASDRYVLMGSMLRSLLEERFGLKIHRDTEEVPMYAMTVAKSGFKLQPMKDGDCEPFDPSAPPEGPDFNANKPRCGNMTMGARGPNASWRFSGFEVRSIAARLSRTLDRHVIDQTGIEGEYIIRLEFHPDENTPGIRWPPERDADTSVPQAASIFTALEQQLGLKIEKTKGPRGFLVIDRIERPSPNSGPAVLDLSAQGRGAMPLLAFDVASIKPGNDKVPVAMRVTPSGISYISVTLKMLIADAYGVKALSMSGADPRVKSVLDDRQRYDVVAKADRAVSRAQLQLMLQALLADRFKLALRRDTKVESVYKLTVLPGGSKLAASAGDGEPACGPAPDGGAVCHDMTMAAFSDYLTSHLNRVVVDDTRLSGRYDFTLKLDGTPGLNQLKEAISSGADPGAAKAAIAAGMNDWSSSSIFADIQKQLGLKLDADKAPVENLVIDHVERPSPNER